MPKGKTTNHKHSFIVNIRNGSKKRCSFLSCMDFITFLMFTIERVNLVLDHDFLPTNYLGWCHGNWSKTKLRLFVFKSLVKIFGPKPNGKLWSQFMTWQVNKTLGPKPSGVQNQINPFYFIQLFFLQLSNFIILDLIFL